jgi:hypothetical protein
MPRLADVRTALRCLDRLALGPVLGSLLLAGPQARANAQPAPSEPLVTLEAGATGAPTGLANGPCLSAALARQAAAASYQGRIGVVLKAQGTLETARLIDAAPPGVEAAVQAALASCPWPSALAGARDLVVRVSPVPSQSARRPDLAPTSDAPGPPPPPVSLDGKSLRLGTPRAAGFRRPVPVDEGCLRQGLRGKPRLAGLQNRVKFAVLRDGSVSQVSFLAPVEPEVEQQVAAALAACRWVPAADPQGSPLAVWVVQPLEIEPMRAPGEAP